MPDDTELIGVTHPGGSVGVGLVEPVVARVLVEAEVGTGVVIGAGVVTG